MEELLDLIVTIAMIVVIIARVTKKNKQFKQNAPGQSGAPAASTAPERPVTQSVRPVMQPTVQPIQPTVKTNTPQSSFWGQMLEVLEEFDEGGILKETNVGRPAKAQNASPKTSKNHAAPVNLAEGSSRECKHGSLGGSMPYIHSDDSGVVQQKVSEKAEVQSVPVCRPAMTAEEMRRAVVMAEILQRPQERMAQQARRWTLR